MERKNNLKNFYYQLNLNLDKMSLDMIGEQKKLI